LLADRAAAAAAPARRYLPRHDPRVLLVRPGAPLGLGGLYRAVRRLRPGPRERRPAGCRSRLQHRRARITPHEARIRALRFPAERLLPLPGPALAERGNRRSCLRRGGLMRGRTRGLLPAALCGARAPPDSWHALLLTAGACFI